MEVTAGLFPLLALTTIGGGRYDALEVKLVRSEGGGKAKKV